MDLESLKWLLLQKLLNVFIFLRRSSWFTSQYQPDELKKYPGFEHLFASRIFRPKDTSQPLPLVIRIHGGGFALNNPAIEDEFARLFADEAGCIVVSVDYPKAPLHRFPAAYNALVDLCLAVIGDASLNLVTRRVVLCGVSAGGNLALAIAQHPRLRPKLLGVLTLVPIVDFVTSVKDKLATRPHPEVADFLAPITQGIQDTYIRGQNVSFTDPRLSPCYFARREDFPKHMYLMSAEDDMLSKEAELMAEKLAQGIEKQELSDGWQAGTVKWSLIRGQKHAFEVFAEKDKDREAARVAAIESMNRSMTTWLKSVFNAV